MDELFSFAPEAFLNLRGGRKDKTTTVHSKLSVTIV